MYDWFGRRIRDRVRAGELGEPADERIWQHTGVARLALSWSPTPEHVVTLASAPTVAERTGRDYLITMGRDPLSAERRYLAAIHGIEYKADVFDRRLEAVAFGKSYLFAARSEESLPGNLFRQRNQDSHDLGLGSSLRLRLVRPLWLKASYEHATRLPTPFEIFGDGVLILANLQLVPERSHNANLSLTLDWNRTPAGDFRAEVNGFLRHAENLIVLLGNDMVFTYQNVYTARSQGLEAAAGWTSPGEHLALDGNLTWQSLRNESDDGTFRDFKGDRIPNRPWLFANLSARLQKTGILGTDRRAVAGLLPAPREELLPGVGEPRPARVQAGGPAPDHPRAGDDLPGPGAADPVLDRRGPEPDQREDVRLLRRPAPGPGLLRQGDRGVLRSAAPNARMRRHRRHPR